MNFRSLIIANVLFLSTLAQSMDKINSKNLVAAWRYYDINENSFTIPFPQKYLKWTDQRLYQNNFSRNTVQFYEDKHDTVVIRVAEDSTFQGTSKKSDHYYAVNTKTWEFSELDERDVSLGVPYEDRRNFDVCFQDVPDKSLQKISVSDRATHKLFQELEQPYNYWSGKIRNVSHFQQDMVAVIQLVRGSFGTISTRLHLYGLNPWSLLRTFSVGNSDAIIVDPQGKYIILVDCDEKVSLKCHVLQLIFSGYERLTNALKGQDVFFKFES